ncbi:ricin domain containing protein [Rhyzopertha dominica]|nr:ricin domain containing protein [Rhyzopertha dominica]
MALIVNTDSGFFLEDSSSAGLILNERKTGDKRQEWILESQNDGTFIIQNSGSGNVLDVEGGGVAQPKSPVITYPKNGYANQRWYAQADGTVVTAANKKLILVIETGQIYPGAKLVVDDESKVGKQIFVPTPI